MELKSSLLFILCSTIFFPVVKAKIVLPELMAKQAINNIRFLSQDGKYTYYQKRSGSLLFSTNYKVQEMLKSDIGTEYNLITSPAKRKILILQNPNFHDFYSLKAKHNIYIVNFGEATPREVGYGVNPQLLLNDDWLSYYDPFTKILNFEHTTNSALKFSIRLNNRINPYFIPSVLMSDDNTVYYTDLGENGVVGLLEFKRNTAKSEIMFKAQNQMLKAEICLIDDQLLLGLFGIHSSPEGTSISIVQLPLKDFTKRETIYKSDLNDLGHIQCNYDKKRFAFIKNFNSADKPAFDIAEFDLRNKKVTPLTELKTVSNIINMDGTLLTQERGKYFIVKGEVDYKNIDSLKAKSDSPKAGKSETKQKEESMEKQLDNE
jgi:hypothetical protein